MKTIIMNCRDFDNPDFANGEYVEIDKAFKQQSLKGIKESIELVDSLEEAEMLIVFWDGASNDVPQAIRVAIRRPTRKSSLRVITFYYDSLRVKA